MGRWINGVLVLSVQGSSDFNERCILRERNSSAYRCAFLEAITKWVLTLPYGSKIKADYWGGKVGEKIVREELSVSLPHFATKWEKK